jgi:hypothetical protein
MREKRPRLTGIATGICFALLIFSLLFVWSGIGMLYLIVGSFGLILVFGFGAGIWFGLFNVRKGRIPAMPLWGVLLVVIVGWPLCVYGPVQARISWMRWRTLSEVPMMPQAQNTKIDVKPIGDDNGPLETCIAYKIVRSQPEVFEFYAKQLSTRGWARDTSSAFTRWARAYSVPSIRFLKGNGSVRIHYTDLQKGQTANQPLSLLNDVEICYSP